MHAPKNRRKPKGTTAEPNGYHGRIKRQKCYKCGRKVRSDLHKCKR